MGTRYHVRCTRSHIAHSKPLPPLHLWKNFTSFPPGWEHPEVFAIELHDSSERKKSHISRHVAHARMNFERMIDEFPPGPYYSVRWRDLPDEAEDPPRPHWAELNPYDGQNDPRPLQPRFFVPDLEKEAEERHEMKQIRQMEKEQHKAAIADQRLAQTGNEPDTFRYFDIDRTYRGAGCPASATTSLVGVTVTQHPCGCEQ
ncbi:hypothetical protein NP493_857g00115 [Ridgeia piscesae]|uniref:Uncharacterized protein n=1 Tax=Ridgeia piscesae TaxID=27915 RepID=A0AAD9NMD8_RIDPI|nr:hypothetical protein NP493_857g00115 [Ridgeia piscesae]